VSERKIRLLEAYHDGELGWLGRWRARRLLSRDADARATLASLETVGGLLREIEAEASAPDLWDTVRLRLPALDVRRAEAGAADASSLPRWIGAGLATVAAALAMVIGLQLVPPSGSGGAVRWLDSRGSPVVVLQDDRDATIIWLLEAPAEVSRRTGSAVS